MKRNLVAFGLALVVVLGVGLSVGWPGYGIEYPCACGDEFATNYLAYEPMAKIALENYRNLYGKYPNYNELVNEANKKDFYTDEMESVLPGWLRNTSSGEKNILIKSDMQAYFVEWLKPFNETKLESGFFYQVLENGQEYKIRGFKDGRRTYDGGVYMINVLHDWVSPKILGELVRYTNEIGETKYKYEQVELVK